MSNIFSGSAIVAWVGAILWTIGLVFNANATQEKHGKSVSEVLQVPSTIETESGKEVGFQQSNQPHEDLDAVLWIQTSAEYGAVARQTFRAARAAVGDALVDSKWTASTEQKKIFDSKTDRKLSELPPAVVLDVDETVLDNSRYQVGLIESGGEYSPEGWKAYVEKQVATPVPGAVEFVKACRTAGVTVIFVTNREHDVETATRENLIAHGLMEKDDPDLIFTKYEKEEWTSDKKSRREELARKYRILLLLGDDLNDFIATQYHSSSEVRRKVGDQYKDWFGERWFILPNPNYGGWEQSLYDWENAVSSSTKRKRKREKMVR